MSWICCQRGAREHYAIPRALHRLGQLELLLTDWWSSKQAGFAIVATKGKARRYHPELEDAPVKSFRVQTVRAEGWQRIRRAHWYVHQQRLNRLFQRACVSELKRGHGRNAEGKVVFAFSYAAKEILAYAKRRGWLTVLGQIDPGPRESEIVLCEHAKLGIAPGQLYQPPAGYWQDWENECALADRIVVNSSWSAHCLIERGVPPAKLRVIPCAFQPDEATGSFVKAYPAEFTQDRPLEILFVGQSTIRKGIHLLMEAARSLVREPVRFTVVGGGLDHPSVEIPANVNLTGPVPRQETQSYYRRADALVLPTLSDGFALVQLEAMAWGLPVITTRRCGDVVQDGVNGLLLSDISSEALAKAISSLKDSPSTLQAMSARSRVAERFSLGAVGKSLLVAVE